MTTNETEAADPAFASEVARVRASGTFGEGGRLRELFEFLAARGLAARPSSQAELAEEVFGQVDSDGDDATVRVYVHRLRKRLDQFYESDPEDAPHGQLIVPAGTYALRFAPPKRARSALVPGRMMRHTWLLAALLVLATAAAFLAGRLLGAGEQAPVNAIWQPFIESERPILVVVGDYYMFGEIDALAPESGRLIRDFRVNSPADLARMQVENPDRYMVAQDVGLTYLPLSSANALGALMPVLARDDRPVRVIPASQLDSQMLGEFNVVYVGLLSGMGLLEDVTFMGSNVAIGETYDELVHLPSDGHFVSGEAQALPLPGYYTDYGYLSVFREPGGGLIAVVAGARDTALRALATEAVRSGLPEQLAEVADTSGGPSFEALFEITGQQGADLSERLVFAAARPNR
jgi:hypothetical protein